MTPEEKAEMERMRKQMEEMQAEMVKAAKTAGKEILKQAGRAVVDSVVTGIKSRVSDIASSLNPFSSSSPSSPADPDQKKKKKGR